MLGTWLSAAQYYAVNLVKVKEVIDSFDLSVAASIDICQHLLAGDNIEFQLAYISANFMKLKYAITANENIGLPLPEALEAKTNVSENIPLGPVGIKIKKIIGGY